jgi:LPXTG-site transpeptidase (sortase) family protein
MGTTTPIAGELNQSKVVLLPRLKYRGRLQQGLSVFLAGGGLLLLLYVSGQYWQMYAGQKRLALEWQQQNAYRSSTVGDDGDSLVRLTIARIGLDAVIVEGTSRKALKLGPGHMADSSLPGHSGNSVIVAHRDTFFRHLDELKEGDAIDLQRRGEVYRFEVTGRHIVEPTDLSSLRQVSTPQLTLITCYPTHYVGPAPKRLVVVARLITPLGTAQSGR